MKAQYHWKIHVPLSYHIEKLDLSWQKRSIGLLQFKYQWSQLKIKRSRTSGILSPLSRNGVDSNTSVVQFVYHSSKTLGSNSWTLAGLKAYWSKQKYETSSWGVKAPHCDNLNPWWWDDVYKNMRVVRCTICQKHSTQTFDRSAL